MVGAITRSSTFTKSLIAFVIITLVTIAGKNWLAVQLIDYRVILGGNILLFIISVVTTAMSVKALKNPNPHAFVRAVYAGFLLRLFTCAIAAILYIVFAKEGVNKYGLFLSMLTYFVYTAIEVTSIQKILREKRNKNA